MNVYKGSYFSLKLSNVAYLPSPMTDCKFNFRIHTHPIGMIFDEIKFGRIFLNIKRFFEQCANKMKILEI